MLVLVGDFNVSIFFSKSSGKEQICPPVVYWSIFCHAWSRGQPFCHFGYWVYNFTTKLQLFFSSIFGHFGFDLLFKVVVKTFIEKL